MPSDVQMFFVLLSSDHVLIAAWFTRDEVEEFPSGPCRQLFTTDLQKKCKIVQNWQSLKYCQEEEKKLKLALTSASSKLCFFQSASSSESSSKLIPWRWFINAHKLTADCGDTFCFSSHFNFYSPLDFVWFFSSHRAKPLFPPLPETLVCSCWFGIMVFWPAKIDKLSTHLCRKFFKRASVLFEDDSFGEDTTSVGVDVVVLSTVASIPLSPWI